MLISRNFQNDIVMRQARNLLSTFLKKFYTFILYAASDCQESWIKCIQ